MAFQEELLNPLKVIDAMFEARVGSSGSGEIPDQWGEREHFVKTLGLDDEDNVAKIPCLNDVDLTQDIPPFTLVRYRAMVQDVFEPELYAAVFEERKSADEPARVVTSKYRECLEPAAGRELHDLGHQGLGQRGACYCVPIPGEAQWARTTSAEWARARGGNNIQKPVPTPSGTRTSGLAGASKRSRCDDDVDMGAVGDASQPSQTQKARNGNAGYAEAAAPQTMTGRDLVLTQGLPGETCKSADDFGLNFPLPFEEKRGRGESTACIVKLYDADAENVRICDTIEVIAVLCVNPEAANLEANPLAQSALGDDARQPSHSLVPRLHSLFVRKLPFYHPMLPYTPSWLTEDRLAAAYQNKLSVPGALKAVLQTALAKLTATLAGDTLAAQYLLLQLVSRIFGKHGEQQLGNWSMSLVKWPAELPVNTIQQSLIDLVPRAVHLQVTVDALNTQRWRPRKDYIANRLVAGQLQLSPGTTVVVDETKMSEGQLNPEGVKNLKAVGLLVTAQQLSCDFSYDLPLPVETSCVIVSSNGKPIIQDVDVCVPLRPDASNHAQAATVVADADTVEAIRFFLALVTRAPKSLNVPDEVMQEFSRDFANIRQEFEVTPQLCNSWMCLARAFCLWHGESALTSERWKALLQLERERLTRCKAENLLQR